MHPPVYIYYEDTTRLPSLTDGFKVHTVNTLSVGRLHRFRERCTQIVFTRAIWRLCQPFTGQRFVLKYFVSFFVNVLVVYFVLHIWALRYPESLVKTTRKYSTLCQRVNRGSQNTCASSQEDISPRNSGEIWGFVLNECELYAFASELLRCST